MGVRFSFLDLIRLLKRDIGRLEEYFIDDFANSPISALHFIS